MVEGLLHTIKLLIVLLVCYLYAKLSLPDRVCGNDQLPQRHCHLLMEETHHLYDQWNHKQKQNQEEILHHCHLRISHTVVQADHKHHRSAIGFDSAVCMRVAAALILIHRVLLPERIHDIRVVVLRASFIFDNTRNKQFSVPVQGGIRVAPYSRIAFHQGILIQFQGQHSVGLKLSGHQIPDHINFSLHSH